MLRYLIILIILILSAMLVRECANNEYCISRPEIIHEALVISDKDLHIIKPDTLNWRELPLRSLSEEKKERWKEFLSIEYNIILRHKLPVGCVNLLKKDVNHVLIMKVSETTGRTLLWADVILYINGSTYPIALVDIYSRPRFHKPKYMMIPFVEVPCDSNIRATVVRASNK
jgi:hypothetical protein